MTHDFTHRTLSRKFVLQRRIGIGGMATVYEATNLQVDKRIAVKVLNPEFVTHDTLLIRFKQEAKSAARLSHPNIVQIHDFDIDDNLPYIVMEYLEGCSLSELIHRNQAPLPWQRVVDLSAQVCAALHYAHSRNILHRDIKPSNVFLYVDPERTGDHVKLLDFGIAKVHQLEADDPNPLTRPSQVPGTPEYMAPEQAQGHPCDARTDLYSVGVMMYRMLTGRLPFYAATPTETLAQHVLRPPPPMRDLAPGVDIPVELEKLILRALAKHPDQRWESALVLREALLALHDPQQAPTRVHRPPPTHPTLGARRIEALSTPGWTTLHDFEWRDTVLRRRRLTAAFSGVSLGLSAFMFFSLFPLPGVHALAGRPPPPPVEEPAPHKPPPPPLLAGVTLKLPALSPPTPAMEPPPPPDSSANSGDIILVDDPTSAQAAPVTVPTIPTVRTRPPPPDPRKLVDSFLKRRRVAFQECSKKIPFGESVTLKVSLTLEPTTGVAVNASVTDEHSGQPYAICAVNVLRRLNYQRYVGPKQFDDLELKL